MYKGLMDPAMFNPCDQPDIEVYPNENYPDLEHKPLKAVLRLFLLTVASEESLLGNKDQYLTKDKAEDEAGNQAGKNK